MTESEQRRKAISRLAKLIGDIPIAMLVTYAPDQKLRSRPMVNPNSKFDGDLWFYTHKDDPKVEQIEQHPQVNVTFAMPERDRYVSLSGEASLVEDRKRIELLWTDACQKWFPDGQDDPQLALLRIDVDFAEYWDDKSGVMKEVGGLVKRAFQGTPQQRESLQHEEIDWHQPTATPGTSD